MCYSKPLPFSLPAEQDNQTHCSNTRASQDIVITFSLYYMVICSGTFDSSQDGLQALVHKKKSICEKRLKCRDEMTLKMCVKNAQASIICTCMYNNSVISLSPTTVPYRKHCETICFLELQTLVNLTNCFMCGIGCEVGSKEKTSHPCTYLSPQGVKLRLVLCEF